jgi:hypothetical protein
MVLGVTVQARRRGFRAVSRISSDYAFQFATYQQITPGASGEVRIDSLVYRFSKTYPYL